MYSPLTFADAFQYRVAQISYRLLQVVEGHVEVGQMCPSRADTLSQVIDDLFAFQVADIRLFLLRDDFGQSGVDNLFGVPLVQSALVFEVVSVEIAFLGRLRALSCFGPERFKFSRLFSQHCRKAGQLALLPLTAAKPLRLFGRRFFLLTFFSAFGLCDFRRGIPFRDARIRRICLFGYGWRDNGRLASRGGCPCLFFIHLCFCSAKRPPKGPVQRAANAAANACYEVGWPALGAGRLSV